MNNNDIMKCMHRVYNEYVQDKEYLREGRKTPRTYEEFKDSICRKAKYILEHEEE